MSTVTHSGTPLALADVTLEFVRAVDAWVKRASVASAGESVTRLRLLNELHCNGPLKMVDLADSLGVTPRAVTALVDGLEAEAQVRRLPHPTDRRVTLVEITGGSSTVEQQYGALRGMVADLFGGVDEHDRAAFARVTGELLSQLEPGRLVGEHVLRREDD
jgi:DNA-binding MarR family transcriptional regulator